MKLRQLSAVVIMVILVAGLSSIAQAAELPPEPTSGTRSPTNRVNVQITYLSPDGRPDNGNSPSSSSSTQLMAQIGYSLEPWGSGTASFSGYTYSILPADTVSVSVYLQKWDGSNWVDVSSAYDIRHNTDFASALKSYNGSGYLRLRTVHFVQDGEPSETKTATSDFIYVE